MLIGPQISAADAALASRLRQLRAAVAAAAGAVGRSEESVTLVAVSKGHGEQAIRVATALGVRDFGESYLQEALPKRAALRELSICWHFIGRIQANKTATIAEHFHWVHGVDRLKIAARLSAQRPPQLPPLNVCIQVNIAAEDSKTGVAPSQVPELGARIGELPHLRLRGLMCMLPAEQSTAANRGHFAALRGLLQQLQGLQLSAGTPDTLSMGMSSDFREAIAEGATLIRIGTALFGTRQNPQGGAAPAASSYAPGRTDLG